MKTEINIEDLPITTNRISVKIDREKFFSRYAIVSYYCEGKDSPKNLAYEQLADIPFESVTGIRERWSTGSKPAIRFFVMTGKDHAYKVKNSLNDFENIYSRIDSLVDYDERIQGRILASLAINSLGVRKKGKMMYNSGSLLLCDNLNFMIPKSRNELVCLKIEINEYMILSAKTESYTNPRDKGELGKYHGPVFQVSNDINGNWWSGLSVKPVVLKKIKDRDLDIGSLFIKKKRYSKKKNSIPYWPYSQDRYSHGRLFAISQVLESVNEKFSPLLEISFTDYKIEHYEARKTGTDTEKFLKGYLSGRKIFFDDSYNNEESRKLIENLKGLFKKKVGDILDFPRKQTSDCLIIRLCEPKDEEIAQTRYAKALYRMEANCNAMQHIVLSEDNGDISAAEAQRILLELAIKDCIIKRQFPYEMGNLVRGWEFARYKIAKGMVLGAILKPGDEGRFFIEEMGFSYDKAPIEFNSFAREYLRYDYPEKIYGSRDYMILKKDGNVYMIIDTEEIPILDIKLIDEAYAKNISKGETLSMFKRKAVAHKYLRGYIGFHLWKSDGIDGEKDGAYSYISGINSESIQFRKPSKMEKMPRARRLFILHSNRPEKIEIHLKEMIGMMRLGFGRWGEMMTYPFPFKFLYEFLDGACESSPSIMKHWDEVSSKDII